MPVKTFAHLLGLGRRARGAKAADDEDGPIVDDYNNDDPLDEENAEEEDDKPKSKVKGRRAKRADDDDAEDDDDDDGDDDDDKKKPDARARGKRAKRADDDGDDADAEDDDKPAASIARERARCAHIMAYGLKNGLAEQAFVMAFDSGMTKQAAISVLKASKASMPQRSAGATFGQAMGQLGVTQIAPDGSRELPAGADAAAEMIIKAGQ